MLELTSSIAPVLQVPAAAAATLRAFASGGSRRVLVTSAGRANRRSAAIAATAAALADSGPERVLIVEVDSSHSALHRFHGPSGRRGLGELLRAVYFCDLTPERTAEFGLGDWLEILGAQGRDGELVVQQGREIYRLRFVHGSIRAISCPTPGWVAGSGDSPRAGVSHRLVRLIEMDRAEYRFTDYGEPDATRALREPWPPLDDPTVDGATDGEESCLDVIFRKYLHRHLRHPFLTARVARYLTDTSIANVKLLTAGARSAITPVLRRPLQRLLNRLGREFDVVLIDAPPVSRMEVTGVVAGLAEGALVVAAPDDVQSYDVSRAVDQLSRGGSTLLGVLVDCAPAPLAFAPARQRIA